jgi:hypothetical protein
MHITAGSLDCTTCPRTHDGSETLGAAEVSHVEGHNRRSRPNGYFQNTSIIGVGQHGPPPKIDLHQPRSAAQVLDEIVNIRSAQARFSDSPLQTLSYSSASVVIDTNISVAAFRSSLGASYQLLQMLHSGDGDR